jgi:(p)ppGpp synthase/HD superfamily hydrolase
MFSHQRGQIIELPKKSTLIDLAYSIILDLGNKYLKGTVDGEFKAARYNFEKWTKNYNKKIRSF